jgi:hypothetical protein
VFQTATYVPASCLWELKGLCDESWQSCCSYIFDTSTHKLIRLPTRSSTVEYLHVSSSLGQLKHCQFTDQDLTLFLTLPSLACPQSLFTVALSKCQNIVAGALNIYVNRDGNAARCKKATSSTLALTVFSRFYVMCPHTETVA